MKLEKILKIAELEKFDWVKKVDGLDKSQRGGYSIIGDFLKQDDYADGLYLGVDKGSYDYYCLFKINENECEIIKIFENDKKSWAKQFWVPIEENLEQSLAEKLFNDIVDTTKNLNDLKELRDKLNKKIEEREKEAGIESFSFEKVFNPIPVPDFREDEMKKIYEEKKVSWEKLNHDQKREQVLIYSISIIHFNGNYETLLEFDADIKTYPTSMFQEAFHDLGKEEPHMLIFKGKACIYKFNKDEKSIKIRFSSR
jgi:hypothetical protein